eukprot:321584_1
MVALLAEAIGSPEVLACIESCLRGGLASLLAANGNLARGALVQLVRLETHDPTRVPLAVREVLRRALSLLAARLGAPSFSSVVSCPSPSHLTA